MGGQSAVGDTDPEDAARQACLAMLAARPRTRAQLSQGLRRRGFPPGASEAVLSRLAEVGLVDDAAFARAWVETRRHSRGLSSQRLASELRRRGVEAADTQAALSVFGPGDEEETAKRLVARRLDSTRTLPVAARFRRLAVMLARKGYPAPLSFRVVREALECDVGDEGEASVAGVAESADAPDADDLPGRAWYDAGGPCPLEVWDSSP